MDAYHYCAEYAHETRSGAIKFSLPVVRKFIRTYTSLKPEDFTQSMIERLRLVMVDYYSLGLQAIDGMKYPIEKIELPKFIFE